MCFSESSEMLGFVLGAPSPKWIRWSLQANDILRRVIQHGMPDLPLGAHGYAMYEVRAIREIPGASHGLVRWFLLGCTARRSAGQQLSRRRAAKALRWTSRTRGLAAGCAPARVGRKSRSWRWPPHASRDGLVLSRSTVRFRWAAPHVSPKSAAGIDSAVMAPVDAYCVRCSPPSSREVCRITSRCGFVRLRPSRPGPVLVAHGAVHGGNQRDRDRRGGRKATGFATGGWCRRRSPRPRR
jgi:hypothetical protein